MRQRAQGWPGAKISTARGAAGLAPPPRPPPPPPPPQARRRRGGGGAQHDHVGVQRRLVAPALQQHQLVRVLLAAKDLVLLAARLLLSLLRRRQEGPGELGAPARLRPHAADPTNCHLRPLLAWVAANDS